MSNLPPAEPENHSAQPENQIEESDQLKDKLAQANFSKLKEIAEVGSKLIFAVLGVCLCPLQKGNKVMPEKKF